MKTERIDEAKVEPMLIALFDHWALTTEQRLDVLGLPRSNVSLLNTFCNTELIPSQTDYLDRAGHLFGIHVRLRLLSSENLDLAYAWVKSPNRAFNSHTPLSVMITDGLEGLLRVQAYLDNEVKNFVI